MNLERQIWLEDNSNEMETKKVICSRERNWTSQRRCRWVNKSLATRKNSVMLGYRIINIVNNNVIQLSPEFPL